ncbi:MAG: DUF1801 domain-containing protein [Chitinophagales bacterium]
MNDCLDYIYNFGGEQRKIMLYLHNLIGAFPEVTSKLKFKVPFYYCRSWICYMNPRKNGNIELCFVRGNELSNANRLLDSKGRKQVSGYTIDKLKNIDETRLLETLQEALLLDEMTKYQSKRKLRKK